ncbi:Piso0_000014 [Millerozyma farinosa CBS 7064]|uniref:Piso0_000014 protein n=1 Tax=Pichia sorbitophila (strain ATCC MYA-4447 / BCRC 22081 / CBS 7064 / NBRC 10061 / NRRL Y-12695) TaxID=559304 RepID=G8YSV4_PICSO|nr:Piso0_000014 [Millerozyma farinosa CBS 7064]
MYASPMLHSYSSKWLHSCIHSLITKAESSETQLIFAKPSDLSDLSGLENYFLSAPELLLVTLYRISHYVNLRYRYTCNIKWWGPLVYRYRFTNLI